MLNKPKHVMSTLDDPGGRPTVKDFLRGVSVRVFPVGRLDFDSEGLMLLTNNGELAQALLHPRYHVPKTYLIKVKGILTDEEIGLVYERAGSLTTYANDVIAYVTEKAVKENVIPKGFKLTTTKTHRKISDVALAAHILIEKGFKEDELYEPASLKSIAKLEKLGQKGQVAGILGDLIIRPEGNPKLVRDVNNAEEDFSE